MTANIYHVDFEQLCLGKGRFVFYKYVKCFIWRKSQSLDPLIPGELTYIAFVHTVKKALSIDR